MGTHKKSQAADILGVLLSKLPDEFIRNHFQEFSPDQVRSLLQEAMNSLSPEEESQQAVPSQPPLWVDKEKAWSGKLAGRTLKLFSDGASRGNPGEAGGGIAILDEEGNELVGAGRYLGHCTNNEAEYRALLFGLEKCGEFGRGSIEVFLDSELIVKQIRGEYKVKHPNLKLLYNETIQKLSEFAFFTISHVPRGENSRADQLANQAIDNK
jgi:ribonuclease HI